MMEGTVDEEWKIERLGKKWDAKPNTAEREDCSLSVPARKGKNCLHHLRAQHIVKSRTTSAKLTDAT